MMANSAHRGSSMGEMLCVVPGCWQEARRNRRCGACSEYRRKYGKDRSEEVILRHARRVFERLTRSA